jgi:hypothetical protein
MRSRALAAPLSCALLFYLATACTMLPPPAPHIPEEPTKAPEMKALPERAADNGLASAGFSTMDPFARTYLEHIAEAVNSGDSGFLLSQGESWYEKRMKPNLDDPTYLAFLYRLGPFSKESPADSGTIPRVSPSDIRSVRFTAWNHLGPILEVRGTFRLADGEALPFTMDVLWKLDPPRILGLEP